MSAVSELVEEKITQLLGPGDPAPFHVENESGTAPVLLLCDHASNRIPQALGMLGLDEEDLQKHIAYDPGTVAVTRHLSAALDAPAIFSGYSRLVIDINRDPDHPTSILPVSDGVTIPGNAGLSEEDARMRRKELFEPYQQEVDRLVQNFLRRGVSPAVVSIHSFTPVMAGQERPWHVGLLWDNDPRLPEALLKNLAEQNPDLVIGDNVPYSGRDDWGYTLEQHVQARGLPNLLVEIRQDLIGDETRTAEWAAILLKGLRPILEDKSLYQVKFFDSNRQEIKEPADG